MRRLVLSCLSAGVAALVAIPSAASALTSLGPARFTVLPLHRVSRAQNLNVTPAGAPIPLWSSSIESLGGTYNYTMVGKNPFVKQTGASSGIPVDVVPVSFTFESLEEGAGVEYHRTVFDPTAPNAACGVSTSTAALTLESPVFQTHSYNVAGTELGNVQYEDAFTRANFAKEIFGKGAPNPHYGIVLHGKERPSALVYVPSPQGVVIGRKPTGVCGPIGVMNIGYWDELVQTALIPALARAKQVNPHRLIVFQFENVVMSEGNYIEGAGCCIFGYHSGYEPSVSSGVQYYATANYDTTGEFNTPDGKTVFSDVHALSHEIGEWINDPNANNLTPPWGHIGQVSGCQGNLEVGDPLSGTAVSVAMPNGVTYHPQEMAFFSWFYRQTPSIGLNGWYSSNGTFTTGAGPICE